MAYLAPSILSADFSELKRQISLIEKGKADYIHVDVMDGAFVPNITFGAPVMKSLLGKTKLPFDVHLMIENPEQRVADFVTDNTEFITFHYEATNHSHRLIQQIKALGVKAGVAINPATPIWMLEDILTDVDMILIMSVNPGFGGQKFIPVAMEKIAELNQVRFEADLNYLIEVDGGVNEKNAANLVELGTDIIVAGSAIFGAEDITAKTKEFKKLIK